MHIRDLLLRGTALTLSLGMAQAAFAQAPAAAPAAEGLGDIVVTAQKRAENVQDTPVAVTAVSQDTLIRQGVRDLTDISKVAPEVQVQTGAFNVVQIRGLRVGTYGPTVDNPNAVHLDGVYLSRYTGLNGFFYDLDRVEVLAGPQGTLYGRNSIGGAMNIITHKPDLGETGGFASIDVGNFNSLIAQGAVNLPLGENVALRVAGYRNQHDGYYTSGQGDSDVSGYRGTLRWQPTPNDNFTVSGDFEKTAGHFGTSTTILNVLKNPTIYTVVTPLAGFAGPTPPGAPTITNAQVSPAGSVAFGACPNPAPGACTSTVVPINASANAFDNRNTVGDADRDRQNTTAGGYNAQWEHDFGPATMTAQGAWRTTDSNSTTGYTTGINQDPRLLAARVFNPAVGFMTAHSDWDSEEIRFNSNDSSQKTYQWTAGAYRFHEKSFNNLGPNVGLGAWFTNNNAYGQPGPGLGNLVIANPQVQRGSVNDNTLSETDAYAVFGQLTYTPPSIEALHITLGSRYNWEEKSATVATLISPPSASATCADPRLPYCPSVQIPGGVASYSESKDWERATYKAGVAYDLTEENMVYATYSTGYASGGYALGFPPNGNIVPPLDHSYQPMTIESWEIGSKNRFLDNRLQVNLSAFKYDFQNYVSTQQVRYADPTLPAGQTGNFIASVNAAAADMKGANLDTEFLLTENDRFHVNAQYLDATVAYNLSDFYLATTGGNLATLATLYPAPLVYPDSFNREGTFGRPRWTANADYTHTFRFGGGATLDAQVAWHYQSSTPPATAAPSTVPLVNVPFNTIPERSLFDLSARYAPEDRKWSITAYVRNALDEHALATHGLSTSITGNPLDIAGGVVPGGYAYAYETGTYVDPRTFGAVFQYSF